MKEKVAIGMSGGVDSSVAAKILKDAGYDVVGLFLKLWFDPNCSIGRENACCDEKALMDARMVADQIGIPLYVVDVREEFKNDIVDYFVDEYKNLRTPNPCVLCNKKIKFGWMLDFAKKIGCEKVATGHYARIVGSQQSVVGSETANRKPQTANKNYHLLKGADNSKDQSYFLHQLDQDQLSRILLPVGHMTKGEVRALARSWRLPVFEKVESQEICFVENDYRDFLKKYLDKSYFESGEIVNTKGEIVGKHDGLINYTIGQRRGVDQSLVTSHESLVGENADKKPLYVVGFDREKNQLIVGDDSELFKKEMVVGDLSLINPDCDIEKIENLTVKIRSRAKEAACRIKKINSSRPNYAKAPMGRQASNNSYRVKFDEPQRAITPGQSAVFYSGDEVVGGGVISQ